jgi:hypothetical protein
MERMTKVQLQKINKVFEASVDDIVFHLERWLDESEYEDIHDYARSMFDRMMLDHRALVGESKLLKATKRPFGFVFAFEGMSVHFFANRSAVAWKRLS